MQARGDLMHSLMQSVHFRIIPLVEYTMSNLQDSMCTFLHSKYQNSLTFIEGDIHR